MSKHVIINADDFGLTKRINEAVIKAHEKGVLTSATIMSNGLAVSNAIELAKNYPHLGVGIHLNLTVLAPVLPKEQVPSLVNSHGLFYKTFWKLPFKKTKEVKKEWRAQIEKVMDMGLIPTHLDSHHHIHAYPPFTQVIVELAHEYKIPSVRLISPKSIELMGVNGIEKTLVSRSWKKGKGKIKTPDTVIGIENYSMEQLDKTMGRLNDDTINEFYLHPGFIDDYQLEGLSSLKGQRQLDYDLLIMPEFREVLAKHGVQLVNYSVF